MELIRTSLKMYAASRQKMDAAKSVGLECHLEPHDSGKSQAVNDAFAGCTVQQIQRSSFDDLCQIYPCQKPSVSGGLPQQSAAGEDNDAEQSDIDITARINRLHTADIAKVLLQPAVLDAIVTELENNFLST